VDDFIKIIHVSSEWCLPNLIKISWCITRVNQECKGWQFFETRCTYE